MDRLGQAAVWLRDLLRKQPWLDAWQPSIAQTPDWVLLATAPGSVLLLAVLLWALTPRGKRAAKHREPHTSPSKPQAEARAETTAVPAVAATSSAQETPKVGATTTPAARAQPTRRAAHTVAQSSTHVRRASGVPEENQQERKARVFLSSTFRDMRAEREVLATDTFPSLKRKFRARGVEVQEVDLRWGVNEGDATLDVCLAAVRRSNWFVGLIGQRYGTTLEDKATLDQFAADYPCVRDGLGRSLTELEILEGVLANTAGDKRVLFFERDHAWLDTLSASERPEYEEQSHEAQTKLVDLKTRIVEHVGTVHAYPSPDEIGSVFEMRMTEVLGQAFPPLDGGADPYMQEHGLHTAYARERLALYLGGEGYLRDLEAWMDEERTVPKLIVGVSGGGKSTLVANWTARWARAHANDVVFAHYLGASPESADPRSLMRRLWLHLNRVSGEDVTVPSPDEALDNVRDRLSERLAQANAFAERENCRILIALDGLDKLAEEHQDLRWWPRVLPPRVKLLASSLDGKARAATEERGWGPPLAIELFDSKQQASFIAETLKNWSKSDLPKARKQRVLLHKLSGLPLFLKTILEELRVSAANDVLDARLEEYLNASEMPDLFARIVRQIETECGREFVRRALSLVWAGRAGLEEDEIVAITGATSLAWERLRNRLADNLRDSQGRVAFAHDYLRLSIERIYLSNKSAQHAVHLEIADYFDIRDFDLRKAEELPFQLAKAEAHSRLEVALCDIDTFESLLTLRGDAEILGYWLQLHDAERDMERLLCDALRDRSVATGGMWDEPLIRATFAVRHLLEYSGVCGQKRLKMEEELVDACRMRLGDDHENTLTAQHNLAHTLQNLGRLEDAEVLLHRVLELQRRTLGEDNKETLSTMGTLALVLEDRGLLSEARDLQQQVLGRERRVLGSDHLSTLTAMNNLSLIIGELGDNNEARRVNADVLEARIRILGETHVDTLVSMNNLANNLVSLGQVEEARVLHERVLGLRMQTLGREHPNTRDSMLNLAYAYERLDELGRAKALQEDVVSMEKRIMGEDHPTTLLGMGSLGRTLTALGEYAPALEMLEATLRSQRTVLGPSHHHTLTTMSYLARVLLKFGEPTRAVAVLEEALAIANNKVGANDPSLAPFFKNLLVALEASGESERGAQVRDQLEAWTAANS